MSKSEKGKLPLMPESLFVPIESIESFIRRKIFNSYYFAKTFAYCVRKYQHKQQPFTVSVCSEFLRMDRNVVRGHLKWISKGGYLELNKAKTKAFGDSNAIVFYPNYKLIENKDLLKEIETFLVNGWRKK